MKYTEHIKRSLLQFLLIIIASSTCFPKVFANNELNKLKPRIIVLTDLKRVHETDDAQSIVRLLSLSDMVEIEGIIISSGWNYWNESHIVEGYTLIWELLDGYANSVDNLMKINNQQSFKLIEDEQSEGYWPSPGYLKRRTAIGNAFVGMEQIGNNKSSEGSRLITSIIDEEDNRPVYILVWGGANVLAQALWDISENPMKKRSPEAVKNFVSKLRVITCLDQDVPWIKRNEESDASNTHYWMRKKFPELFWLMTTPGEFQKKSDQMQPFYQAHVQGHGALGNLYPDHSNSVEGDTPTLFYVLPTGFTDPEKPQWGTIAGYFEKKPYKLEAGTEFWQEIDISNPAQKELTNMCITPQWNLFATRLDWARSGMGNRPPVIVMNGDITNGIIEMAVQPGETITLDASDSFDNEMDKLRFEWSVLPVPGAYSNSLKLENKNGRDIKFKIPKDAEGKELHILLTLTDDGAAHHLSNYQRVVLKVE